MRIRLLLAVAATLALAGCGSSPTAPGALRPGARTDDLTCRGGYHIATRDGTITCVPDAVVALSVP